VANRRDRGMARDSTRPPPPPLAGEGWGGGQQTRTEERGPNWQVSTRQRARARELRANSTDAERLIWAALRAHRTKGAHFRRQVPIGPYIVDFVCHACGLVIELDGGQHFESKQEQRDGRRDAFIASKRFRVLRFNNYDVLTNRDGVLETIAAAIEAAPSLTLPRKRGRGPAPPVAR
jgi:very-short-patch-repair endonuclease